ncbi:hypothetical protein ACVFYP_24035 [Roseomonas sp. F4]
MHPDFEVVQIPTETALSRIGFTRESDEDFSAAYRRADGWRVEIHGERYMRPAYDLVVFSPYSEPEALGYSVPIIFKIFYEWRGLPVPVPSVGNLLKFLSEHEDYVFNLLLPYRAAYIESQTPHYG